MDKMYKATDEGNVLMTDEEAQQVLDTQANYKTPKYIESKLAAKKKALKQAASDYESSGFSNVGIAILAAGVIQGKPKALAVAAWAEAIWAEYFKRDALITLDTVPDLDFSSIGAVPYTILELREELTAIFPNKPK